MKALKSLIIVLLLFQACTPQESSEIKEINETISENTSKKPPPSEKCSPVNTPTCDGEGNSLSPPNQQNLPSVNTDKTPLGDKPQGQKGLGTKLSSIQLSYLGSIRSLENGIGNIADPSIVEFPDGSIRVYFKNGNEPQAGISGYDNKIHSAISTDGGKTWEVEQGIRVPIQSPIEALVIDGKVISWGWGFSPSGDELVRYESVDGLSFNKVDIPKLLSKDCIDEVGNTLDILGDPAITQLNDGSWLMHAQELKSKVGDFNRRACVATSSDGLTWTFVTDRIYGGEIDVTTNPTIHLSSMGFVEWIWPTFDAMLYRSSKDGKNWSSKEYLPSAGDPDFLDLEDGTQLLSFGNFNPRQGGVLIFTKRVTTNYSITVLNSFNNSLPSKSWIISSASKNDIKVVNLCLDQEFGVTDGTSVTFEDTPDGLKVTAIDSNEEKSFHLGCVYILVGPEQVMG